METILIADDENANIYLLEDILSDYELLIARNGFDVEKILEEKIPDLILLDIMMSGKNGLEVASHLRKSDQYKNIPIIFITAMDKEEDVVKGFEIGAFDYIKKPFDFDELLARVRNVLKINKLQKELENKSKTDSLTRLWNHATILELLDVEINRSKRYNTKLSILMLDIDHFKMVNDNYGHQAGDEVLIKTVEIINDQIRKIDIAGRYGGEEFLVILPNIEIEKALIAAERIRNAIQNYIFNISNLKINKTVSIGLSEYDPTKKINEFINEADTALYEAKNNGRNRTVIYSE